MSLGLRLSSTIVSIALLTFTTLGTAASALDLKETPGLAERVGKDLPPVAERVPAEPLVVDLEAAGRGHERSLLHTGERDWTRSDD